MASTLARFETLVYAAPVDNAVALWMRVRLPATTPVSLNGCGGP
jgi:hypothetical protein